MFSYHLSRNQLRTTALQLPFVYQHGREWVQSAFTLCSSRALRMDTLCSRSLTSLSCWVSVCILILLWYALSSSNSCCSCILSTWYSASCVSSNRSWSETAQNGKGQWGRGVSNAGVWLLGSDVGWYIPYHALFWEYVTDGVGLSEGFGGQWDGNCD